MDATPLSSPGSCQKTTPEIVLTHYNCYCTTYLRSPFENSRFSSLLAKGDVSRGGAICDSQRQKFHTDDVNQCLHDKSGSHGVPNANLFNFTFLLVDFGKVLCSSRTRSSKTQMLFLEKNIFHSFYCFSVVWCVVYLYWALLSNAGHVSENVL